jgi:putative ABC transport system permease protein
MTRWTVIARSLRYYWRSQLGVLLGTAVASMVLTGSLLVGASVKATLRQQAMARVGQADAAVLGGERFFRDALASETGPAVAPVLLLRASVSRVDGGGRINQAQLLGVDTRFWSMAPKPVSGIDTGLHISQRTASQLGLRQGDTVVLRVEKPALFSRDAPLSGEESQMVALRLPVAGIVTDMQFGRFGLQASQVPPFNLFLPLHELQEKLGMPGRANVLLAPGVSAREMEQSVTAHWQLEDAGLELRTLSTPTGLELRSPRVFLGAAEAAAAPKGVDALTYLVNEMSSASGAIPYSMVTALDAAGSGFLPAELSVDEIVLNQWTAEDLRVGVGDSVTLKYFTMGDRRQLQESSRSFKVLAVLPMDEPQLNGSWMADFPGLSDQRNCRDWKPGFDMDPTRFREKDEAYWQKYRGTPKAFVNIAEGQKMWGNRWGALTAIRYPADTEPSALSAQLLAKLSPSSGGARFVDLRKQALAATRAPVDFAELFVSFSFFLIAAAAVLTGLLFAFAVDQRQTQVGLLLATGWRPRAVRWLFLLEGGVVAGVGGLVGAAGAILYTRGVLFALETVWKGAVGAVHFVFEPDLGTLTTGVVASVLVAIAAMLWASRKQFKRTARALLSGGEEVLGVTLGKGWGVVVAGVSFVAAILLAMLVPKPEAFFGAGALLLMSGLAGCRTWLQRNAMGGGKLVSLAGLARRNTARRAGRSLAVVTVLACGVFVVVAVDSFRQRPVMEETRRSSGTGGFALVAESAVPIYEDLNSQRGREAFGMDDGIFSGVSVVPLRVRDGDDASCLNLNRALEPRVLAVKPDELASRKAFTLKVPGGGGWEVLEKAGADGSVPAFVDEATLQWALQKKVGDAISYTDEQGMAFEVRVAGTLKGSMLQGNVVVAESQFVRRFPGSGGYRFFLIDAPSRRMAEIAAGFSRALQDRGWEVVPAWRRMADFQAVENTYLQIFQVLGALGLVLGSVGLAVVVARNVLERRSEFALFWALGFRVETIRRLVLLEHFWLVVLGLGLGVLSAGLAVWPTLRDRESGFPVVGVVLLMGILLLGGLLCVWVAARTALKGVGASGLAGE